jgi:hypothetical protein
MRISAVTRYTFGRTGRLPEDEAALWDWLLAQDSAIVSSLIAYCIASAMKPVMDSVRLP